MNGARLGLLLLVAFLAMSLSWVASASAEANPLFAPVNGQGVTGTSGGVSTLLVGSGQRVECQAAMTTGAVASSLLLGAVRIAYLECRAQGKSGGSFCTVKSAGAPREGLILTQELHGILGLILPTLEIGILLLPVSGKVVTELAESKNGETTCTPETKITGSFAGLVTPVGKRSTTGKITFPGGAESIKKIDLTHGLGLREPELIAFTAGSTLAGEQFITYSEATEVT
jgi:hypothetical protein